MAKMAEQEGFDSLWVFARLLSPLKPQTPYPVVPDGSLLVQYQNVFDPIETLSFVAATKAATAAGAAAAIAYLGAPSPDAAEFAASISNASFSDTTR